MKRVMSFLAIATLSTTVLMGAFGGGHGGGSSGTGNLRGDWPYSGTHCLTIDDTNVWVYTDLLPLLQQINADSGLVGTAGEMHATFGVNFIQNGVYGWHGNSDAARASADQIRDLARSGLFEIASHGYSHRSVYPYRAATASVLEDSTAWAKTSAQKFGGLDDGSLEQEIAAGYVCLTESLGVANVHTFLNPNHAQGVLGSIYMPKYFRNSRAGGLCQTALGSEWPNDANRTGGDNLDKGVNLWINHDRFDPIMYWWYNYDAMGQTMWGSTFFGSRMWIPHTNIPTLGSDALTIASCIKAVALAAESKGLCVFTFHQQNVDGTTLAPDLGGMTGVEAYLRGISTYCVNLVQQRDGPKLQMLTIDEAMQKYSSTAYQSGPSDGIDNWKCIPDTVTCNKNAAGYYTRPWGYPEILAVAGGAWADSGWGYVSPDSVFRSGTYFSYNVNDAPDTTVVGVGPCPERNNTCGIFATTKTTGNYKGFITVVPAVPGSRVRFSLQAATSEVDSAGTVIAAPNYGDYISTDFMDITITPIQFSYDPTDTTDNWAQAVPALGGGSSMVKAHTETGFVSYSVQNWTGLASEPATQVVGNAYLKRRTQGAFHMADGWTFSRSNGFGQGFYQNGTGSQVADKDTRWREFYNTAYVPEDCNYLHILITPVGFQDGGAADGDTLVITQLSAAFSPR